MENIKNLYVWEKPTELTIYLNHTWVTDYDYNEIVYNSTDDVIKDNKNFWFCWGDYIAKSTGTIDNPSGFIGKKNGDIEFSNYITKSNSSCENNIKSRGFVFYYGIDGVCHQLANEVLYSTKNGNSDPITLNNTVRGYKLSHFIYGVYGLEHALWTKK